MDVVSAKTSFFEGITLSFCPCGYAQPPEGDKPSPLIEPIPWAEAHGYKGCVPPGRVPASQLIYLRKKILRAPELGRSY